MKCRDLLILQVLALTAMPMGRARAVEFPHRTPGPMPAHHCTCRFHGENVDLGEHRCLQTPDGPRTAECVMVLNMTSWRPSRDPCPEASLTVPRGG